MPEDELFDKRVRNCKAQRDGQHRHDTRHRETLDGYLLRNNRSRHESQNNAKLPALSGPIFALFDHEPAHGRHFARESVQAKKTYRVCPVRQSGKNEDG